MLIDFPDVPDAFRSGVDEIAIRRPSPEAAKFLQDQEVRPLGDSPEMSFGFSRRMIILKRRWVHHPKMGKGAVWADSDTNETYGPICFVGLRTMDAPAVLEPPEGGW